MRENIEHSGHPGLRQIFHGMDNPPTKFLIGPTLWRIAEILGGDVAALAGVARPEGPTRRRHADLADPAKQERSDEKMEERRRGGVLVHEGHREESVSLPR